MRVSGLGFEGAEAGERVTIRVFMNMPTATSATPASNARCVADISDVWRGEPLNLAEILDETKTKSVIGDGDITLTVVSPNTDLRFWFKGLYLALFADAR